MSEAGGAWPALKRGVVAVLGRPLANRIAAPFHDWRARRRTRRFLASLPARGLCVNVGCGPRPLPGWINLDAARAPHVDVFWDVRQGLPFPDASCTALLGEHVIEHVSKQDALRLARECWRVLEPGGVLRLSTPDLGRYLRSYAGDHAFLLAQPAEPQIETAMDRINHVMRQGRLHLWCYDAESLGLLLRSAGFAQVGEQRFGESIHERLRGIDDAGREAESLYVEAVR